MKKLISAILILVMLLALAACTGRQQTVTDPTAAPTQTAAPTDEPTEPAETATEPTAEPVEPVELYFEDCSRIAAKLPWGTGDNEVAFDPRFEDHDDVPGCFDIEDGRIYLLDRWVEDENSLLVYDTASGEISRIDVSNTKYGVQTEFAVIGGELITPYMIFNIETGEETLLQKPPVTENVFECTRRIVVRGGECRLYISEPRFTSASEKENTSPLVTEYKLDRANLMWQPVRRYLRNWDGRRIQLLSENDVDVVLERGTERGNDEYIGCDAKGFHYVVTMDYRGTEEAISTYKVLRGWAGGELHRALP